MIWANTMMKLNLQNKLLFPVIISILLFMSICAFVLSDILIEKNQTQTVELLREGNNILVKNIRNLMNNYRFAIRSLSNAPIFHAFADHLSGDIVINDIPKEQALRRIQELLTDFPNRYIDYSQLNFISSNGEVIASSRPHIVGRENLKDKVFFKDAVKGHEAVSSPTINPATGDKVIYIASPVFNSKRQPVAVLCGIIPCTILIANTIEDVGMSKTGYAYIVDGNSGLMLAHNVYQKVHTMDMYSYQPWMRDLKPDESGVKADYRDSRGVHRLAIYHKEPRTSWIAVSCVDFEEIEAQSSFIRDIIILMMFGTLLLVSFVLIIVVRSVTNDVHKTNKYAQEITAGYLDSTLDVKRDDELGDLGLALHRMVDSLKQMVRLNIAQTEERKRNLAALRDSMLITLADLVESRDQNTGEHIRKTASYVRVILEELRREGLFRDIINDDYILRVVSCAPLHDIGKIKVPDAILNKPGKLTDEEFSIMKTHAAMGGEVIGQIQRIVPDSDNLVVARDIATYHHEKWNGSGYPDGLAGDAIPLSARVMAVADVFDALVSERAYKQAFSTEKAFSIIQEESGRHFDPRIVSAFLSAKEEILQIEQHFRNHEIKVSMETTVAYS